MRTMSACCLTVSLKSVVGIRLRILNGGNGRFEQTAARNNSFIVNHLGIVVGNRFYLWIVVQNHVEEKPSLHTKRGRMGSGYKSLMGLWWWREARGPSTPFGWRLTAL